MTKMGVRSGGRRRSWFRRDSLLFVLTEEGRPSVQFNAANAALNSYCGSLRRDWSDWRAAAGAVAGSCFRLVVSSATASAGESLARLSSMEAAEARAVSPDSVVWI